ncbi:MAG: class I adenylate-forming enzyme family protein [Burkholderiaceae bacterium]
MSAPQNHTMFELLCERAALAPDQPFVLTDTATISYAKLEDRARRVASKLAAGGIGKGSRIGLLATNRIEWLEVFFGASALGAIIIPISTWSTATELAYLLNDSRLTHLFTLSELADRNFVADIASIRAGASNLRLQQVVVFGAEGALFDPDFQRYENFEFAPQVAENGLPSGGAAPRDTLVVLYTSGSSNRPKAVPLVHQDLIENGFGIGERQGLDTTDRVLVAIPLFWSYGAANALPATLTHGACLVLQERFEAGGALALIEQHQCTAIYTLPAMTNALLSHASFEAARTASLRTGVTIGTPQDVTTAATQLGAGSICNIYGSTETYGNCCVTPHDWSLDARATCQGPPLPGVQIRIRDGELGELCEPGAVGQIEVKGYLTPGYDGDSARHNAQTFTADGYFRTGDLGALNTAGALVYAGRSTEMIKRSGINVSPAEVEEVLQQHPQVGQAAVTGVDDARRGEIIVAYVIAARGLTVCAATLIDHCRKTLSAYKVPDRLLFCDTLPLTATGKLMRRELKAIATVAVNTDSNVESISESKAATKTRINPPS